MKPLKMIETKPLTTCLEKLREEGFTKYFAINNNGLHEMNSDIYYKPGEFKVATLFNIKEEDIPANDSILYAIETNDGLRGILSKALRRL